MGGLTTLYLDCFSGVSGDMLLGALIDVGVPFEDLRAALGSLAVAPETVWTERVTRAGVSATRFRVLGEHPPVDRWAPAATAHRHGPAGTVVNVHAHGHDHPHDHHEPHTAEAVEGGRGHTHAAEAVVAHRTLAEIESLIDGSALDRPGKARAKHLFQRLGAAEAAIHNVPLDRVHLHEVGALDSIIDVVGAVYAMDALGVDRVVSSPLNVGGGIVRSAHGLYPVPAPATLRLLTGAPIYAGPQQVELVTPTGALLVTDYAQEFGPMPSLRVRRIGYGAGTRDLAETPNVLRVVLGEDATAAASHSVVVIEAEIDDMNPQIFGVLMERLLADDALDVFYTPIQMKKSRPGTLLSIVAAPSARERLTATIFRETTTIGVRYREMMRECLDRETVAVDTSLGAVRVKIARRNGAIMNASPEFDDCVRLATEHGRPVKEVQALAMRAFMDTDRLS